MRTLLSILACYLLAPSIASAQPPQGPIPTFKIVASTDKPKGIIRLAEMQLVREQYREKRVRVIDGMQVVEAVEMTRTRYVQVTMDYDATKSRVITPDGKQLPIDEVWKRLKANTVVAVAADGKAPAEEYLRALNANTLVVIFPQTDLAPQRVDSPPKKIK
jgi:hypothetical protein